jgi:Uma2 family endonuclease
MTRSTETPRTVEELLRLPEDEFTRHELIGGQHFVNPSPIYRHQLISSALHLELGLRIDTPDLGRVCAAPVDVVLSPTDLVVPDLIVILESNRDVRRGPRIEGPPDLVVEITSPSTQGNDLELKRELYERAGVREYWIVLTDEDAVLRHVRHADAFAAPTRHEREISLSIVDASPIDLALIWKRSR